MNNLNNLSKKNIKFISEQDGESEIEFKKAICVFLSNQNDLVRAYLVQVDYINNTSDFNVALCLKVNKNDVQHIVEGIGNIFKKMFGSDEHLDIFFLNDQEELLLREVCCPFYTSKQYQIKEPDFYLISSEGYGLQNPIGCYKKKKLCGKNPNGYMLCDIKPSLNGLLYSRDEETIDQLVFASRHENYSLFPIPTWPAYVHIAVPVNNDFTKSFYLNESDIKLVAWGELYKKYSEIKRID